MSHLALGTGGEFERLRAIFQALGDTARDLGDDCAVIPLGDTNLVASIDASVAGVHFRTDWLSLEEIGWRATAAALSDLAADGATPLAVLVSLGLPGDARPETGEQIMKGAGAAASAVGASVAGGDLVHSRELLLDVCVLGTAERPVRRSGAKPGDGVWVTGTLGGAGRALADLQAGRKPAKALRARYAHPEPRIAAGHWLAAHGATAMLDISDGLSGDAAHLAAASGVKIAIALEQLPCWPGVSPGEAAASGEEFELLVALPDDFSAKPDFPLTRIGSCGAGSGLQMTDNGKPITVLAGYSHFA